MASTIILSDNGVSSGSAGLKETGGNDGVLILQTTTAGGTATNAVYIDATQNVGVGTATLYHRFNVETDIGIRNSSGSSDLVFRNTTQALINNVTSSPLIFNTANTERMRINATAPVLCLAGGNTSATGTGITFPATQSASTDANTLDDYEEGTFTPVITSSTGSITTQSGYGKYTKVGNQVTVTVSVTLTNVGTAANIMSMTAFPFGFVGSGAGRACSAIIREDAFTGYAYMFVGSAGQTAGTMYTLSTNVAPPWTNGYQYTFSVSYLTS